MKKEHQTSVELENRVVAPITPGATLMQARMEANLSLEEVATRLCLRSSVIESIEADNYSGISRHVFSRGYLRAYARIMNLDADKIIELFNALNLKEAVNEGALWQTPRVTAPSKDSPVKWLLILVITCICFLMAMWWNAAVTKKVNVSSSSTNKVSIVQPISPQSLNVFEEHDSLGDYTQVEGKKS